METLFTLELDDRFTMRLILAPTSSSPVRLRVEYGNGETTDRSWDMPISRVLELMRHGVVAAHVASLVSGDETGGIDGSPSSAPWSESVPSAFVAGLDNSSQS